MSEEKEKKVLSEKIYFEDSSAKITNARVTCRHLTVPVEKIGSVNINYKVETFSLSVMCLVISCSPFLFFPVLADKLKGPVAGISVLLIIASLLLLFLVYRNYAELIASVDGRCVILLKCSMGKKEYVENLYSKIANAILDERRYRNLKASGNLEESLNLNPSETLRLKMVLEDYEDLKNFKKDFEEKRKEAKEEKEEK